MKDMKKTTDSQEFLRCSVCGNVIIKLEDSGLTPQCCGRDMEPMKPNTVEADHEFHIPVWQVSGRKLTVKIGEKPHPMTDSHFIKWIFVKTDKGSYTFFLCPEDEPEASIKLCHNECVCAVYCYCNIHGLWKATLELEEED